jgi:hypothetical protein
MYKDGLIPALCSRIMTSGLTKAQQVTRIAEINEHIRNQQPDFLKNEPEVPPDRYCPSHELQFKPLPIESVMSWNNNWHSGRNSDYKTPSYFHSSNLLTYPRCPTTLSAFQQNYCEQGTKYSISTQFTE